MEALLLMIAIGQGPIEVTLAPGLDAKSRTTLTILTAPFPEANSLTSHRLCEIRREVDSIVSYKILDPHKPNGSDVAKPAIRIGRIKWETIPDEAFATRYGVLLWMRWQIDPWWTDVEIERRGAVYDKQVEEYICRCKEIREQFFATHNYAIPDLGETNTRIVIDKATGLHCYLMPCMPPWPEPPPAPEPFDIERWIEPALLGPVEAKR